MSLLPSHASSSSSSSAWVSEMQMVVNNGSFTQFADFINSNPGSPPLEALSLLVRCGKPDMVAMALPLNKQRSQAITDSLYRDFEHRASLFSYHRSDNLKVFLTLFKEGYLPSLGLVGRTLFSPVATQFLDPLSLMSTARTQWINQVLPNTKLDRNSWLTFTQSIFPSLENIPDLICQLFTVLSHHHKKVFRSYQRTFQQDHADVLWQAFFADPASLEDKLVSFRSLTRFFPCPATLTFRSGTSFRGHNFKFTPLSYCLACGYQSSARMLIHQGHLPTAIADINVQVPALLHLVGLVHPRDRWFVPYLNPAQFNLLARRSPTSPPFLFSLFGQQEVVLNPAMHQWLVNHYDEYLGLRDSNLERGEDTNFLNYYQRIHAPEPQVILLDDNYNSMSAGGGGSLKLSEYQIYLAKCVLDIQLPTSQDPCPASPRL